MSSSKMPVAEKKEFVVKHVFTDVVNMEPDKGYFGSTENHFNVPWRIGRYHMTSDVSLEVLVFDLECLKLRGNDKWSIETETEFKLIPAAGESFSTTKKYCYNNTMSTNIFVFSKAETPECFLGENLTVEMHVKITKMKGIKTEKLRNFDESSKKFSDIILKVGGEKFYVLKKYLAAHSSYFESLFYGHFDETKQSEIELKDVDSYNFQNFLEALYAEPAIDEDTVEGILHLGDMYDAKSVFRNCEKFLTAYSKQPLKMKFEIAIKYKLDKLTKKCISKMKTKQDILSALPQDVYQMDQAVWAELLHKIASFN